MASQTPDMFAGADPADKYLLVDLYRLVEAMARSDRKLTRDILRGLIYSRDMGNPGDFLLERRPQPHEPVYLARYMANLLLTTNAWATRQAAGVEKYLVEVSFNQRNILQLSYKNVCRSSSSSAQLTSTTPRWSLRSSASKPTPT